MDSKIIIKYKIKKLKKRYLKNNIEQFKDILYQVSYQYWTEEHFLRDLPGKWDYSYIAVLKNKNVLIGFCICSIKEGNTLHIHKFFVDRDYRGHKIGQNLLKRVISTCVSNKIKKISVNVYNNSIEAIHIYKKLGFSIKKVINDNIGERYFMTRDFLI